VNQFHSTYIFNCKNHSPMHVVLHGKFGNRKEY
jgi:hypothetical protein